MTASFIRNQTCMTINGNIGLRGHIALDNRNLLASQEAWCEPRGFVCWMSDQDESRLREVTHIDPTAHFISINW